MAKRSLFKKVLSVTLATVLAVTSLAFAPVKTLADTTADAESGPLTTVVKMANVGGCTGGSYVQTENNAFEITGAGSIFDKDTGKDSYNYVYFDAQGTITVTAKITPGADNNSGMVGIIARNDLESESQAAGVYYDYSKGTIRNGRHGGAGTLANIADVPADGIYMKLEFSEGAVYYTLAKDAAFTDIIYNRNGMGATGLNAKNVGFFATEGNTATISEVLIKAEYTDSFGRSVKKVVYDSETGELIPTFSNTTNYQSAAGTPEYLSTFTSSVDGNKLTLVSTKGANKGDIRSGKSTDYLLFPATTKNLTISADMTVNSMDTGTDKHGAGIGQFAVNEIAVTGSKSLLACSMLQYNKNYVTQLQFTTAASGDNGGNPKTEAGAIAVGGTYNLQYTKNDNETATLTTKDVSGKVLAEGDTDLTVQHASLASGKLVQYGIAISVGNVTITNLTLKDSDGWILYDQNDYYVAKGVAPEVTEVTGTVTNDRLAIVVDWKATEGSGSYMYAVMVSKDGGDYTLAGTATTEQFTYAPSGSGTYTFKVYGQAGEDSTEDTAAISEAVNYVAPLATPTLTVTTDKNKATVSWTSMDDADTYHLYRTDNSTSEYVLVKTFDSSVTTFEEELGVLDTNYYYMVTEDSATGNTSNPTREYIAVSNADRTSADYLYGDDAAVITITDKSNDTVTSGDGFIAGTVDKAGSITVVINGEAGFGDDFAAGGTFEFAIPLTSGRNDVELIFQAEGEDKVTRKAFSFYLLEKYDLLVDASATADGTTVFNTVVDAIAAVKEGQTIFIKNGNYEGRIVLDVPNVTIIGEDSVNTKVYASVAVADKTASDMWTRNAFYVGSNADGLVMENFTIENSFPYTNGNNEQADALAIVATDVVCVNLRLVSFQDTLLVDSRVKDASGQYEQTKQYFYKCYITGNVDFIYGSGSAIFDDCDIVARYTDKKSDGCYTAGRTYSYVSYGLVFINSRFLKEDGIAAGAYRLARPWGADAHTQLIDCYICDAVSEAGYGDMSGNSYTNARFDEYLTFGPGFAVDNDRTNLSTVRATALLAEYETANEFITEKGLTFPTLNGIDTGVEEEVKNGLVYDESATTWYLYVDGAIATDFTGFFENGAGKWYIENGVLDTTVQGLRRDGDNWLCVRGGKFDTSTGLVLNAGDFWYVSEGVLDTTYKGIVENAGYTWYVVNGKLNTEFTGIGVSGSDFYYVVNGKVKTDFTGVVNNADAWWYVVDGKVAKDYTGTFTNDAGTWYIVTGKIDISFTGLGKDADNNFIAIRNGKYDPTYTGLISNAGSWWYVQEGKLDATFTGIVENSGGSWLVVTGKLASDFTGTYTIGDVEYTVVAGKIAQ